MATVIKTLTAVNDAVTLDLPTDSQGAAGVQIPSGADTFVLEGTINNANWVAIGLTPAAGGAVVGSIATAGIWWADVSFCEKIRVRKTAGVAAIAVALTLTHI